MGTKKKHYWGQAVVLALVPILFSILYTLIQGHFINEIFLPDSGWNDELMYFKLVEAIREYGAPRGFYGFNESRAEFYSFAAWSPVIISQWAAYAMVFGWNLFSPFLSNILTLSIALFAFALLTKPSWKETGFSAVMLMFFKPVARYTLSCVPEIEMFSLMIVYLGLCINLLKFSDKKNRVKLVLTFVAVAVMTLIRPYMILFIILPCVIWIKMNKERRNGVSKRVWLPVLVTVLVTGLIMAVYLWIGKHLCAAYLEDLFSTDWIKAFIYDGFSAGVLFTLKKIKESLSLIIFLVTCSLKGTAYYAAGLYYFLYGILIAFGTAHLIWRLVLSIKNRKANAKERQQDWWLLLELQIYFVAVAFGVADVLMYRIEPGGRHTLIFILSALLIIPVMDFSKSGRRFKFTASSLAAVFVLLLFFIRGNVPYEYSLPYNYEERSVEIENLNFELCNLMTVEEDIISFENTIGWAEDCYYGELYAVPKGIGINFLTDEYIILNYDSLKCRYLGVAPDSYVENLIISKGAKFLAGNENISFYQIY